MGALPGDGIPRERPWRKRASVCLVILLSPYLHVSITEEILCHAFIKPQCAPPHKAVLAEAGKYRGATLTWGSHNSKSQSLNYFLGFF